MDPTAAQYEAPADREERPDITEDDGRIALTVTEDRAGAAPSGALPFTGFDAAIVAAVALLLGATGLALRRLTTVR